MARDYGALYPVARAVLTPLFKLSWRVHTSGLEHVPETGGAIICPNHVSVLDSFFVPLVLPRRITYVGKAEYMDDWKTKFIFPAMGMVPIDRSGGDAAQAALDTASRILEDGELFGIYPEGTRSRDGDLHRGHTGAARLALRTGAPIMPVGLIGTREVQPPDARFPDPFRPVWVRIGRPVHPGLDPDRMGDHRLLRQVTDEVMFEIGALSGQTYIDEYANKKPDEDAIPRRRGGVITADGPQANGHAALAEVAKAG
ncbi:MAG: lysophospholipid acyltransferase family protein [Acidimicrobiales bacterium]|jgi:1-acyl-sn-glycerol-3-phosphate acyltransferase